MITYLRLFVIALVARATLALPTSSDYGTSEKIDITGEKKPKQSATVQGYSLVDLADSSKETSSIKSTSDSVSPVNILESESKASLTKNNQNASQASEVDGDLGKDETAQKLSSGLNDKKSTSTSDIKPHSVENIKLASQTEAASEDEKDEIITSAENIDPVEEVISPSGGYHKDLITASDSSLDETNDDASQSKEAGSDNITSKDSDPDAKTKGSKGKLKGLGPQYGSNTSQAKKAAK